MSLSTSLSNVGRAVAYYPRLSKFFGSVNASILFSQLFYWHARTDDERGVFKSAEQWTEETGLSYREQATARRILVERGFLVETQKRLQHRVYYKLDLVAVDTAFDAWDAAQNSPNDENALPERRKRSSGTTKTQFVGDENAVRGTTKTQFGSKEESTAESTAESAGKPAAPAVPVRVSHSEKVLKTYLAKCESEGTKAIPDDHPIRAYCRDAGITLEMASIAWVRFKEEHTVGTRKAKRSGNWPALFASSVKDRWYKLWNAQSTGEATWTTEGLQARRVLEAQRQQEEVAA